MNGSNIILAIFMLGREGLMLGGQRSDEQYEGQRTGTGYDIPIKGPMGASQKYGIVICQVQSDPAKTFLL